MHPRSFVRRRQRHVLGVSAGALLAAATAACGSSAGDRPAAGPTPSAVPVSVSSCGTGWTPAPGSRQVLVLHNTGDTPGEVQVVDDRGRDYDGVDNLAAGTPVTLHLTLASGRYAVRCLLEDEPTVTGPLVTVHGDPTGQPGIAPVTAADLVPAARAYQRWVQGRLPGLVHDVDALRSALVSGERARARRAWLAAHLDYERLGAAYGAFGPLNDAIDGFRGGRPRGFHLVERDLWSEARQSVVLADVERLARAVHDLRARLAGTELDPGDLTLRAHEITENALQFQLRGDDDFGSHSDLASVAAQLDGTRAVLRTLRLVLTGRIAPAPLLAAVDRTRAVVVDGPTDVAVRALPRLRRERIDAAVSGLTQQLAPVAATLEPRRS